ncbi:octanoyltransferase [Vibrio sp. HA2012]|uniref:lipoyl(octanoyl) transferase LipB n=1 Tax=Vibrio sp. HA2012 TaxID=1971595 RepID=UPI000C2CA86D|nr:lipoyl(octanoyl) transferase LipB [Vibrio sp. HA2012]PJC86244.1 octanoyltransferase [Vibrio sp. HA2012]
MQNQLIVRDLGYREYLPVWQNMQDFTDTRTDTTPDEIWLVEHPPVFTQGQAGSAEHLIDPGDIPVIQSDRGGQVTYHGQGQLVAYFLLNLRRKEFGVRELVTHIETLVIETLNELNIESKSRPEAPGVYVDNKKICSLGLRVRKGCTFHGLALNIDMDLSPFLRINPCGYQGLEMTQIRDLKPDVTLHDVKRILITKLVAQLQYSQMTLL